MCSNNPEMSAKQKLYEYISLPYLAVRRSAINYQVKKNSNNNEIENTSVNKNKNDSYQALYTSLYQTPNQLS